MASAMFARGWITGSGNATLLHLLCEDGSEVVVDGSAVRQALKRRVLPCGTVVFRHRVIRVESIVISLDRRTDALGILVPARWTHPRRLIMMPAQDVNRLREALVRHLDGWTRSNGATTTNRTSVTQKVA